MTVSSPGQDGYGPTILAVLEYVSRMYGIHADLPAGRVWWSACDQQKEFAYTQRWGDFECELSSARGRMTAHQSGTELFTSTGGVRVVTDLEGKAIEVVGIAPEPRHVVLHIARERRELWVSPNQVIPMSPSAEPKL